MLKPKPQIFQLLVRNLRRHPIFLLINTSAQELTKHIKLSICQHSTSLLETNITFENLHHSVAIVVQPTLTIHNFQHSIGIDLWHSRAPLGICELYIYRWCERQQPIPFFHSHLTVS